MIPDNANRTAPRNSESCWKRTHPIWTNQKRDQGINTADASRVQRGSGHTYSAFQSGGTHNLVLSSMTSCGKGIPSLSTIRTNSAKHPARIFCMTLLRRTLTVNSVVPSSTAIFLLSRSAATSAGTSRSRWVNKAYRARYSAISPRCFRFSPERR